MGILDDDLPGPLMAAMIDFFEHDKWPFSRVNDEPILRTNFIGDNGEWRCYAKMHEEKQQFVFYAICPLKAPVAKRPSMAEFITRANYGMVIGNFEMDFSDGEIRYKTSMDVEGLPLGVPPDEPYIRELLEHLVYANVLTMDRYLPGIMKLLSTDLPVSEIIAEIEG